MEDVGCLDTEEPTQFRHVVLPEQWSEAAAVQESIVCQAPGFLGAPDQHARGLAPYRNRMAEPGKLSGQGGNVAYLAAAFQVRVGQQDLERRITFPMRVDI
jgi:hypothetical protein